MQTAHFDRPLNPRSLGKELLSAARCGSGKIDEILQRISQLPKSQAAQLGNVAVELCGVQSRRGNADEVHRSHIAGARLTVQCGLSFPTEMINDELVPLLLRVPAVSSGRDPKEVWLLRLVRTLALGQLAPRIHETEIDGALRAVLAHSRIQGALRPDIFLAFADFEESFRIGAYMHDGTLRTEARNLCLRAIADLLELAVEGLAESTPETFTETLNGLMPWARIAAASLLTVAPSINGEALDDASSNAGRIVEAMEWLLKRPFGFPGDYFQRGEQSDFESARSLVSLAYGVLAANSPAWREKFEALMLPDIGGMPLLGTAFLSFMKRAGVEKAVEWGREIAQGQLAEAGRPNDFASQLLIEAFALSWHLGAGQPRQFEQALEFSRNPTAQLLCAKALNDSDPWERGQG